MPFLSFTNRQRGFLYAILAYAPLFLSVLILHPGGAKAFENYYPIFHLVPHLVTGACCLAYAARGRHRTPYHRVGWMLLGLAALTYQLGNIIYLCLESSNKGKVAFPSWADAAWCAVFPLLIAGLWLLFGNIPSVGRVRLLLDSAIATGSIGILSWYFLVQKIWMQSGVTLFAKVVGVIPPIGDVAALFGAIVLINTLQSRGRSRLPSGLLASGIIFWAFADIFYTYASLHGGYHLGSWFDWGWPFGAFQITLAALLSWWIQSEEDFDLAADSETAHTPSAPGALKLVAPYLAAGTALSLVITFDYSDDGQIGKGTFFVCLGLMLLVMVRQVFTLWENRHLTVQLSEQLTHNQGLTALLTGMNEELLVKIQEADMEITARKQAEEELREAKASAEAANRAKSQFLTNMSHELRTPLNAIIGFSEILVDQVPGELNPVQSEFTQNILIAGKHLLQLINDILDLAKIEAGRLVLDPTVFDPLQALQDIQAIANALAKKKNITLTIQSEETPSLYADLPKFKQIAFNLLSNAIKFTPNDGTVTVRVQRLPGTGTSVTGPSDNGDVDILQVSVTDSGIGLKQEDQNRIFEEFEQVDSSYTKKQQGTGLGLALTKKLVEMHGGQIHVTSEGEGKGSTFTFALPYADINTQEACADQAVAEELAA